MTAELGDWLTEVGDSEPASAAVVAGSLVAVLVSADPADLAAVGLPGRTAEDLADDPRASVDRAYQRRLEELQGWRRRVADAATLRYGAELRLSQQRAAGADPAVLHELTGQLVAAQQREAALATVSQRLQADADAYRTVKETAKALYTAAEAQLRISEAIEAAGGEREADLGRLRDEFRAAEKRLRALIPTTATRFIIHQGSNRIEAAGPAEAERPNPPPAAQRAAEPVPGLLELRADPLRSDLRILFAEEPAGTITLLAVLEDPEAVSEHGPEAIKLAGDLLTEIREDGWPADVGEVIFEDSGAFLARFFPETAAPS